MASITIRDIDERFKARLRVQAAHHGRSMEEEARDILADGAVNRTFAEGISRGFHSRSY